jgi:hypothetical protein
VDRIASDWGRISEGGVWAEFPTANLGSSLGGPEGAQPNTLGRARVSPAGEVLGSPIRMLSPRGLSLLIRLTYSNSASRREDRACVGDNDSTVEDEHPLPDRWGVGDFCARS